MTEVPQRVLLLTQYFPPEVGAPQARLSELALLLKAQGYEIEVLTALPSYPQGKLYQGYRLCFYMIDHHETLKVIRTPLFPTRSPRLIPRLANYLSFVASSLTGGALLCEVPDIILVESPPLFLGLTAVVLKHRFNARLVFNVADLWPESALRMGLHAHPTLIRAARSLERFCYAKADAVTGQTPGILHGVQAAHPRANVALVPNGCDTAKFSPQRRTGTLRNRYHLHDKIVVGYAGLLGVAQGVGQLVNCAQKLRKDSRFHIVIVGDGPERPDIQHAVSQGDLSNVTLTGLLPRHQLPEIVADFDVAYVPLRYTLPGAVPSKLYEAMASGVPILLAADGEPADLVNRAGAGEVVPYHSVDATVNALWKLASPEERMPLGQAGRDYVVAHHGRAASAEAMNQVFQRLK